MNKYTVVILYVFLFYLGCSPVKFTYDSTKKNGIPGDLKDHFKIKENQSLLEFTSVFKEDSILIIQGNDTIFNEIISTSEMLNTAKLLPLNQSNTTIYFRDRLFKIDLKGDKLKKFNYIYISSYPKIDTADWITKETLKKSNYKVEFSNEFRVYD